MRKYKNKNFKKIICLFVKVAKREFHENKTRQFNEFHDTIGNSVISVYAQVYGSLLIKNGKKMQKVPTIIEKMKRENKTREKTRVYW